MPQSYESQYKGRRTSVPRVIEKAILALPLNSKRSFISCRWSKIGSNGWIASRVVLVYVSLLRYNLLDKGQIRNRKVLGMINHFNDFDLSIICQ